MHALKKSLWVSLFVLLTFTSCQKQIEQETNQYNRHATGLRGELPPNYSVLPRVSFPVTGVLPASYIISDMPPAGDQGTQASCVAFATGWDLKSYQRKTGNNLSYYSGGGINSSTICSPSYIYNQIKVSDCSSGSFIPTALDLLKTEGVCTLTEMPYNENTCSTIPSPTQKQSASYNKILSYQTVKLDVNEIKTAIYNGNPVVIGIHINDGLDNAPLSNGHYIWKKNEYTGGGNHAMLVYGYDDNLHAFKALNSWGSTWKESGSIWIDYSLLITNIFQAYVTQDLKNADNEDPIKLSGNMNFGNVNVGSSAMNVLTMSNQGKNPITIYSIGTSIPLIANFNGIIPAGGYVTVNATFIPQAPITYSGYLKVYSNSKMGVDSIPVTGTGISYSSNLNIAGDLNFGNVTMGGKATKTIQLINTGISPITVSNIVTTSNYSVDWTGGIINAGGMRNINVSFTPSYVGSSTGSVTILSNASNSNVVVSSTGSGTASYTIGTWVGCSEPTSTITIGGWSYVTNHFKFRVTSFSPSDDHVYFEWGVCNSSFTFPDGTCSMYMIDDLGNNMPCGTISLSSTSGPGGYFNFFGASSKTFNCFMTTNIGGTVTYYYAGQITLTK